MADKVDWKARTEERGKALCQASAQHCWETQGIIYQGWHVWLIPQHTRGFSFTPKANSSFDTDTGGKGVKLRLIFGSRRRRWRQQLILNLFLRSIEIGVTAPSRAISILYGTSFPLSSIDLSFMMGPDGEVDICIVILQRRITSGTSLQSISQSIRLFFCMFCENYWWFQGLKKYSDLVIRRKISWKE